MHQWIILVAASWLLIAFSWNSLRHQRLHGIHRFFAWETILALWLLNAGTWFYHLSPSMIASVLAVIATLLLIATAKADEAECRQFFGPPYQGYMRRTKMFIPNLLGL
jgi:protein-S-isoprenylcysteine O-methyltransferase Ste14